MFLRVAILMFFFMLVKEVSAQEVTINLKLVDSSSADAANYNFKISVRNTTLGDYWVQDTAFLLTSIKSHSAQLIYAFLWKKEGHRYLRYEHEKHYPGTLYSKCMDSCCNCTLLKRNELISFSLPMLTDRTIEKGSYKMKIALHAPINPSAKSKQPPSAESNYIFFNVKN
jgi:hypothetical protein